MALCTIMRRRPPTILTLEHSLRSEEVDLFVQKIINPPPEGIAGFQELTSLTITNVRALTVRQLVRALPRVQKLSLVKCDFEIADLFQMFIATPDHALEVIDISENHNDKSITRVGFPKHLKEVIATSIEWEIASFTTFWQALLSRKSSPIALDLAYARLMNWNSFYTMLADFQTGKLAALRWDDNPVRVEFVTFLKRCKGFKRLSISGCLDVNTPKAVVDEFLDFIRSTRTLNALAMGGTPLRVLTSEMATVLLHAIKDNRSITRFDISGNRLPSTVLGTLAEVLSTNEFVQEIVISGNEFNDFGAYTAFFGGIQGRTTPLFFEWPEKEFMQMRQYRAATDEQIRVAREQWDKMIRGNLPEA
jgi:hypothetical protein